MSSSVASGDTSSVTPSVSSHPPPSPATTVPVHSVEYQPVSSLNSTALVEPQNPFDSIDVSASGSSDLSHSSFHLQTPSRNAVTPPKTLHNSPMVPQKNPIIVDTPPRNNVAGTPTKTPVQPQIASTMSYSAGPLAPTVPFTPPLQRQNNNHNPTMPVQEPAALFPSDTSTSDDDNTAPSSTANTSDRVHMNPDDTAVRVASSHHHQPQIYSNTLTRLWDNTYRRWSAGRPELDDDDDGEDIQTNALIAGYLQKLGRNGKWQARWFETDGECLSYYKNEKRSKLLATLDLQKVGLIEIDVSDPKESSFRIQVMGRLYHLRADSRTACKDWVITLNRVKEARMEQGNVKLVSNVPRFVDMLDQSHSQSSTPRLVVVSNRQRTRAVDEEDQWSELIHVSEDPADPAYINQKRHSALSSAVVARWSKRRSSLQRLGAKLTKWARSLKKYSCAELDAENVFLDQHVHPPGHDDKANKSKDKEMSGWIDKEATRISNINGKPAISKPPMNRDRGVSTSSDYDSRMIS